MSKQKQQKDLHAITHQLRAPISALLGALSGIKQDSLEACVQQRLGLAQALAEDACDLCYGTLISFAREAGQEATFFRTNINAPAELRRLCRRLQITNPRPTDNLAFVYDERPGFPMLRMDRNVFTCVFYGIVHNAIKYADPDSTITLASSFMRDTGRALFEVESIGEPILPNEKDLIFKKFRRGRIVERTGRHHVGAGLGLWVARDLMEAVGGNLSLKLTAEAPRKSVFIVQLPKH